MDISKKLEILAMSAKYDASCASSGSSRQATPGGIGTTAPSGICHSWSDDGRCISLLKILQTNICSFDCAYCCNRASNDIPRALFEPEELASLAIEFYKRNYIEGLFLSSAVFRNPDYTMELMLRTVRMLRREHSFSGYIHVKAMPGADPILIRKTGLLADRMSANIELPSQKSLSRLAPDKDGQKIFSIMSNIHTNILDYKDLYKQPVKKRESFIPAGQSTQLIVGASPENDRTILHLSQSLYRKFSLRRVYYSAYISTNPEDSRLPVISPPLRREHRLYQADWLIRFYGFSAEELLSEKNPDFDLDLDPKCYWALCNLHLFPVEVMKAEPELLLRVPGMGPGSVKMIIRARRVSTLDFHHLKKIGVVLKRARFFITCNGRRLEKDFKDSLAIKERLMGKKEEIPLLSLQQGEANRQLLLFPAQETGKRTSSPPIEDTMNGFYR